ncbi:MAG: hypothetical protein RIB45_02165 [Marivibrio sp.]|uniref:hypothetical protein n=1 Tax=Marivibrio sp. TaxID=2039719 RepID=UPI0032EF7FF3
MSGASERAPPGAADSTSRDAILVIGVHREELAFGDAVAAGLEGEAPEILRIPEGVPRACSAPNRRFYSETAHHEIYRQLRQETRRRASILIDLHCGRDAEGAAADLYCHDAAFLRAAGARLAARGLKERVRLIKIVDEADGPLEARPPDLDGIAHTWVPRDLWAAAPPLYVGLEIYTAGDAAALPEDAAFARAVIAALTAEG